MASHLAGQEVMTSSHWNKLYESACATQDVSGRQLRERAAVFMQHYPDIHALVNKAARDILKKRTGKTSLDPARVYWHRFTTAFTSPRTFTGWQHSGPPSESMSFVELLMCRFSAADQDATDDLNVYGGFYTAGADQDLYDEHNEVPMLPSQVQQDFWAIDFAAHCKEQVETFWRDQGDDFCTFAMVGLLSAAGVALSRQQISPGDFRTVLLAVTGSTETRVTWSMLQERRPFASGVWMQVFTLDGKRSRDMLCISDSRGRQILYQPDAQPAFVCLADEQQVERWVQAQLAKPSTGAALAAHFVRGRDEQSAFVRKLARPDRRPWRAGPVALANQIAGCRPVFEQLRDRAREEMRDDIHQQLTTSASLRKQMWIGYLGAFIHVAGAFAPLGWPIGLTLIGAGIANIGLNIDQAISGRTAQLRKAGVVGAIVNSVFLLLNLPLLAELRRPSVSVQAAASEVDSEAASLKPLQGNAILSDTPKPAAQDHLRGVHVLEKGDTWISLKGRPYRVQYVKDLKIWCIVRPDNPFSFSGARLVRFSDAGEWELVGAPKLRGGMQNEGDAVEPPPFNRVSSTFWDTHMRFDLAQEQRLSVLGNQRQQSVMSVYELESDEEILSDADGDDIVFDMFGEKHRVFKAADDWFGGAISRYTHDDDLFNLYLRTGEHKVHDQVATIEQLVEDLAEISYNNDVTLYRGGSGERGTSGKVFREGKLKAGDVLVNTDITSFSENPYMARVFASSQGGVTSASYTGDITFDDTSVVFEIPAKHYLNATPISPFSVSPNEVESVFLPGNYFEIQRIEEVAGSAYRFMNVQLKQVPVEQVTGPVYDLRTGVLFNRADYAAKLGAGADALLATFFPAPVSAT
jgi:hypothetical protein